MFYSSRAFGHIRLSKVMPVLSTKLLSQFKTQVEGEQIPFNFSLLSIQVNDGMAFHIEDSSNYNLMLQSDKVGNTNSTDHGFY